MQVLRTTCVALQNLSARWTLLNHSMQQEYAEILRAIDAKLHTIIQDETSEDNEWTAL